MPQSLFTLVSEYGGGTYVSQVHADNERQALKEWASHLLSEQPMGAASGSIGIYALGDLHSPTPVAGLTSVWCWTALVADELVLTNIIRSA